ncbi:hypothetical protein [Rhizobium sp. CECT 9324]|uniref:hypothetical protein n=1 Tax=Rhizobium sp. CECT 9324 TaxID=2845820 RepID=UPI001E2C98BC|nr:hypothetical protein [Rhizobium sp. CECT 9324]CAH0339603.1 hypothetical protein RHI9324_01254 [Rhizobium sp. CECT 9324]
MTPQSSFAAQRDNIVDSPAFQAACQRYAKSNGSSEAIAMAVLTAIGFPDLFCDAMRYRWMRDNGVITPTMEVINGADVDAAVDAVMIWEERP